MVMLKKHVKKDPHKDEDFHIEKERKKVIANAEKKEKDKEWTKFLLRIKSEFLEQIDVLIEGKIGMNRTVWILQRIQEGIKKEARNKND